MQKLDKKVIIEGGKPVLLLTGSLKEQTIKNRNGSNRKGNVFTFCGIEKGRDYEKEYKRLDRSMCIAEENATASGFYAPYTSDAYGNILRGEWFQENVTTGFNEEFRVDSMEVKFSDYHHAIGVFKFIPKEEYKPFALEDIYSIYVHNDSDRVTVSLYTDDEGNELDYEFVCDGMWLDDRHLKSR